MGKGSDPIRVHRPTALREVVSLLKEHPGAGFIAGGVDLMRKLSGRSSFLPPGEPASPPDSLISLADVDELTKIRRKENTVEIGAAVPLERIISLGVNVVPPLLLIVLSRIAGPAVRNLATLGGNVVLASPFSDALLPLLLLEARCELRRLTAHAWLPLARFIKSPRRTALAPLEFLTGISLPIPRWNVREYVKLDIVAQPALSLLKFAGLARVDKATVADFRLIWGGVDPLYLRDREIEALFSGAKIPFAPKLRNQFAERVGELIESAPPSFLPGKYHRRSAVRLALSFLDKVSSYRET
jgi:CO/xanthine dehydrogenase FAD-binding subunit